MVYKPEIHHRRSIRLKGYDYTQPGAYFVTIVACQREEIFGQVIDGRMILSPLGQIAYQEWMRSIAIRKEIRLHEDEFVIMPNHMHGIVWIVTPTEPITSHMVGADSVRPGLSGDPPSVNTDGVRPGLSGNPLSANADSAQSNFRRSAKSLGSFVAGFKAAVTSRIEKEFNRTVVWQRNYYEHIIRNEAEFRFIWDYIDRNPLEWEKDQLHPKASPNRFNQDRS